MIDIPDLAAIAENDEHAAWIVASHVGGERYGTRQRCAVCDEWWPCGMLGLAALAALRAREVERLRAALASIRDDLGYERGDEVWKTANAALAE